MAEPAHDGWSLFNPTIAASGDGFDVIVRSSNYRVTEGRYVIPEEDAGRIRTENILLRVDGQLRTVGQPSVLGCEYDRSEFPVDGLEDCRLNVSHGRTLVSATVRNAAGRDGLARIAGAEYTPGQPLRPVVLNEPTPGRHEKNWMPLVGTETWLYSCRDAGRVVTVSRQGDRWSLCERGTSPTIARGFRGGSQLVPYGAGWVAVVHEVADDEGGRTYEHRFVWFDEHLSLTAWSPPFAFREPRTIEFAAGLAWLDDRRLVVTFGVRDTEAWVAIVNHDHLLASRRTA